MDALVSGSSFQCLGLEKVTQHPLTRVNAFGGDDEFGYGDYGGGFSSFGVGTAYDPTVLDNRLIVAGGGGGTNFDYRAGGNAGPPGGNGDSGAVNSAAPQLAGTGGTQSAAGTGGYYSGGLTDGYLDNGGSAGNGAAGGSAVSCVTLASEPTAAARRKRVLARQAEQKYLQAHPACPASQRACTLPSGNFECIDFDELTSCGGCVSDGSGVDCLSLPGVSSVTCLNNECVPISCLPGFVRRGDKRAALAACNMCNDVGRTEVQSLRACRKGPFAASPDMRLTPKITQQEN
ncbi:hypothetical protein MNV49_005678 [Pseudohyphozyma bogoriensis]|nr:hypothetical protein MNV49_005678 [Pseudohyphozyma bogoriensis]